MKLVSWRIAFNNRKRYRNPSGHSLVEVMVAITLLGLLISPVLLSMNNLNKRYRVLHLDAQAYLIAQENLEITTNILQSIDSWQEVPQPISPQSYAPPQAPDWEFKYTAEPVEVRGSYRTWLVFQPVCRNEEGEYISYVEDCTRDNYSVEVVSETFWGNERHASIGTIFANLTADPNDSASGHKLWICHVPPGSPENAHVVSIDRHAWETGHDIHNAHSLDFEATSEDDPSCGGN